MRLSPSAVVLLLAVLSQFACVKSDVCAGCVNKEKDNDCKKWAKQDYCIHPTFEKWMNNNCRLACESCDCSTDSPSESPSSTSPSASPTASPSSAPTFKPSGSPSISPSHGPTSSSPSRTPSTSPTPAPTNEPTDEPTAVPTGSPITVTSSPSLPGQTYSPTSLPSYSPTLLPSTSPSRSPSQVPSNSPSVFPSSSPSNLPTSTPSIVPSASPSKVPTTSFPSVSPSSSPTWPQPNIMFIILDDWRDTVNIPENHPVKLYDLTPNIFKLKDNSMNFERAYAQYPQCSPSRSSILTGWYPTQLQHYSELNDPFRTSIETTHRFEDKLNTTNIPKHFKENGYYVGVTGKVFHMPVTSYLAYESWVDVGHSGNFRYKQCGTKYSCTCTETLDVDSTSKPCFDYLVYQQTLDMIKSFKQQTKPWLIMTGFVRPHSDWSFPKSARKYVKKQKKKAGKKGFDYTDPSSRNSPKIAEIGWGVSICKKGRHSSKCREAYYTALHAIDNYVGGIVKELKDTNQYDNTVIILTSDHGFSLGEDKKHYGKWTLSDTNIEVPLLIRSPAHPRSWGKTTAAIVELVDLFPTMAELAQIDMPDMPESTGKSLVPLLDSSVAKVKDFALSMVTRCNIKNGYSRSPCTTRERGSLTVQAVGHTITGLDFKYTEWRDLNNVKECSQQSSREDCMSKVDGCYFVGDFRYYEDQCISEPGISGVDWSTEGLRTAEYYDMFKLFKGGMLNIAGDISTSEISETMSRVYQGTIL